MHVPGEEVQLQTGGVAGRGPRTVVEGQYQVVECPSLVRGGGKGGGPLVLRDRYRIDLVYEGATGGLPCLGGD